jgi:alanine dehydrogenase
MKIGILKEGKVPADKRVPLTPKQCKYLQEIYPQLEITVQPSPIRAFADKEYKAVNIKLSEDLTACDILMGVKEVPMGELIPNKTYLFFSHTYKKQPYNRDLLKAILAKKIRLIDYEMLKEPNGKRVLGFGRYAGIVGAYNAFRAYGKMTGKYELKAASLCENRIELEAELIKVQLPRNFRIALTGAGKVAAGAKEILSALKITQVFPKEYKTEEFNEETVYTQLDVRHYFKKNDGSSFTRHEFFAAQGGYKSNFMTYAKHTDMYLACHFWSEKSPFIFTREDAKSPNFNIKLISDISADIDGPVASTLRPSTIADPFYGYDAKTEKEVPFGNAGSVGVCAVDNLPCELPRDASEDFGNELIKNVMPHFFNDDEMGILNGATETTLKGELSSAFSYLEDYVS